MEVLLNTDKIFTEGTDPKQIKKAWNYYQGIKVEDSLSGLRAISASCRFVSKVEQSLGSNLKLEVDPNDHKDFLHYLLKMSCNG